MQITRAEKWMWAVLLLTIIFGPLVSCIVGYAEVTVKQFPGYKIVEKRRHRVIDDGSGGLGRYEGSQTCIDRPKICFNDDKVPTALMPHKSIPWLLICDPESRTWLFFHTGGGRQVECENCTKADLVCGRNNTMTDWIPNHSAFFSITLFPKEKRSERRVFKLGDNVTLERHADLHHVPRGQQMYRRGLFSGKMLGWLYCDTSQCEFNSINMMTGVVSQTVYPCNQATDVDIVEGKGEDEPARLFTPYSAPPESICVDKDGKPVFPMEQLPESERWRLDLPRKASG